MPVSLRQAGPVSGSAAQSRPQRALRVAFPARPKTQEKSCAAPICPGGIRFSGVPWAASAWQLLLGPGFGCSSISRAQACVTSC